MTSFDPRSVTGTWSYPTAMRFGPGRIAELPDACGELGMTRPLFVTDPGLADLAITRAARATLAASELFHDVAKNPVERDVTTGVEAYRAGGCDGVVAFGGGAALDAAKAIALMVGQSRPLFDFEDVGDNWKRVDPDGMAAVVAVPTTAGTGSEVGRASVILDTRTSTKRIVFHPRMLPAVVISDPELTVGLPPAVTAATGMDAFVHCLEAFCAPGFHPFADGIAVEGMRLVARWLPRAFADGGDVEARAGMLAAASMGAAAFQKGLGAVHAISHPVGAVYDTHHGLTNAVVLPYVLAFNRKAIEERCAYLARVLALGGSGFDAFFEWVTALRAELGIPETLAALGVDDARADEIGEMASRDAAAAGNPRPVDAADLRSIFVLAITGR